MRKPRTALDAAVRHHTAAIVEVVRVAKESIPDGAEGTLEAQHVRPTRVGEFLTRVYLNGSPLALVRTADDGAGFVTVTNVAEAPSIPATLPAP